MSEEGRRQLDLLDLINAHPGKRILDALHAYGATTDVLAGNARQLRTLIQSLEDPADPLEIGPMGERAKLQRLFGEVFRLFHNFLSSVKTLIDHTRNLVNEDFVTEAHRSEYEASVQQEFASDPLARFMQDFRNHVLHHAVPKIELTHRFLPEPRQIELNIDATAMLASARWTVTARSYLQEHQPKLRILHLLDGYETKARTFHEHFAERFRQYYQADLKAVSALMKEWNSYSPAATRPR